MQILIVIDCTIFSYNSPISTCLKVTPQIGLNECSEASEILQKTFKNFCLYK